MIPVAICVITYRRPAGLARLLEGIARLRFSGPELPLEIVVVDNDAAGTAREVCASHAAGRRWPLRYAIEPQPGIASARNCAVALALERAERIAFIDDDEVPEPEWLDELLAAAARTGADVVAGPVLPVYSEAVPEWIRRGGFFDRPRHPDGAELDVARTGNVLIHRRVFESLPADFDPRFGLTGSEDTHFFLRVRRAGFRIVWADRAVVTEWLPAKRATAGWLLQRAYRGGNGHTRCELAIADSFTRRAVRTAKGLGRVSYGLIGLPFGLLRGRAAALRFAREAALGLGTLAALFGSTYQEYRRKSSAAAGKAHAKLEQTG
jgi:glycosyltransferase involved in cell wall biosynthesis